jgi:hypothetical protein
MNYSIVCKGTVAYLKMLGKILNSIVVTDDHGLVAVKFQI